MASPPQNQYQERALIPLVTLQIVPAEFEREITTELE
jgi:hypothetical protein